MRSVLEAEPNLSIREGMATGLDLGPNDEVTGVRTFFGIRFACRAAVLTTGTFMNGRIWVGKASMPAGRYAIVQKLAESQHGRVIQTSPFVQQIMFGDSAKVF